MWRTFQFDNFVCPCTPAPIECSIVCGIASGISWWDARRYLHNLCVHRLLSIAYPTFNIQSHIITITTTSKQSLFPFAPPAPLFLLRCVYSYQIWLLFSWCFPSETWRAVYSLYQTVFQFTVLQLKYACTHVVIYQPLSDHIQTESPLVFRVLIRAP